MRYQKTPSENALMQLLAKRQVALGLSPGQMADLIGISESYYRALANGNRPADGLTIDKLRGCAEFLGVSVIQAAMLAEAIRPRDFVANSDQEIEKQIERARAKLTEDPDWGRVAPTPDEWAALSLNTRYGIVLMYEKLSHQEFVEKAPLIMISRPDQAETDPAAPT